MKRKYIVMLVLLLLISSALFIAPSTSYACSCGGITVEEDFLHSRAVFSGKVIEIESDPYNLPKNVLFEVHEVWKGDVPSQMVISTGEGGDDCGFLFEEGTEYLVYANESNMYGITDNLVTHSCSRTNEISLAEEDLQFLGVGKSPIAVTDASSNENGEVEEPNRIVGLEDVEPSTANFALGIMSLTLFIIVLVFYFSVFKKRKK